MNAYAGQRTELPGEVAGAERATDRLGGFTAGQWGRLCELVGVKGAEREAHERLLWDLLGPAAARSLAKPPPSPSCLSDDHTPVEFSLTFPAGAPAALRVVVDPGCGAGAPGAYTRTALAAVGRLAAQHGFDLGDLKRVSDLLLPPLPQGPPTLWCALVLRPGGAPRVKLYLNPGARGAERSAETLGEAMTRLGHGKAFEALRSHAESLLPGPAAFPFLALDVGPWAEPRVKVYVAHQGATATEAADAARLVPGARPERVAELCRRINGEAPFDRLPLISCYSFTTGDGGLPTGHTLHVPVRAYVRDDLVARRHAVRFLRQYGVHSALLDRALAALTARRLSAGVGLISYLGLVQEGRREPRITVYLSSEAYRVLPPRDDADSGIRSDGGPGVPYEGRAGADLTATAGTTGPTAAVAPTIATAPAITVGPSADAHL
ncbi:tryptophan dimethylallyltransferase family protein [Streptomyces sp. NPDC002643]